jgi:hypothetical protein
MPDATSAATAALTKAPAAFWDVAKKYWIFAILLLITIAILVMRWRDKIAEKMQKAPTFLRSAAKLGGYLLPLGLVLGAGAAYAAAGGGGAHCCADTGAGWLDYGWKILTAILGGGVALGISMFSAPDVLDAKNTNDGTSVSITPGATTQEMSLYIRCPTKNKTSQGAPLVAVDTTISVGTTVTQTTSGTASLEDDDLSRILNYLEIEVPNLGVVLDQVTGKGPVLDLLISFVGQGFNRAGDAPVASITVPGSGTNAVAVTKYFTYPWAQRFLKNPTLSCPWLGMLDEANLKLSIAANTVLAAASTAATFGGTTTIKASTSYIPHPYWFQPMLAKYFVDKPASGSDGLTFKAFGGSNPSKTDPIDWVFLIGQISNLKGLPGNLALNTITKIIGPSFGLDDVSAIDHLVKARLQAQVSGRTPDVNFTNGGNYAIGTATGTSMAMASLLFLLLRQPSLDMTPETMLKFDSNTRLPIREEFSSSRTGEDAFIIGSLRKLSLRAQQDIRILSGNKMPVGNQPPRHYLQK